MSNGPIVSDSAPSAAPNSGISRATSERRDPGSTSTTGGLRVAARRLLRVGAQLGEPLDQRMADIDARRAAEPLVRGGLERQQRQHLVDIGLHLRARPGRHAQTVGLT